MSDVWNIDKLLELALEKCKTKSELSRRSGVSRDAIRRLRGNLLKGTARNETIGAITKVILRD